MSPKSFHLSFLPSTSVLFSFFSTSLELVDLVLRKAKLSQNPLPFFPNKRFLHPRRSTHKDLCILRPLGQDLLQQLPINPPPSHLRTLFGLAHCVLDLKPVGELPREVVQLFAEKHVVVGVYAEDKSHAGFVLWVAQDALCELEHWRYPAATCDEGDVRVAVGLPFILRESGEDEELVAWFEGVKIAASSAVGVFLHQKFHVSRLVCTKLISDSMLVLPYVTYQRERLGSTVEV